MCEVIDADYTWYAISQICSTEKQKVILKGYEYLTFNFTEGRLNFASKCFFFHQ